MTGAPQSETARSREVPHAGIVPSACRTLLAGPGRWKPRVRSCSDRTRSLIQALHDRHIGITPWLAERLEAALDPGRREPASPELVDPWVIAINQLKQALRVRGSDQNAGMANAGRAVIVSAAPSYFVFRVAAFLLDRACRRIGRTVLFCEDWLLLRGVSETAYLEYERELMTALLAVVRDEENELELFWYESAVTLSGRASSLSGHGRDGTSMPQVTPVATALLKRMRPSIPDDEPDRKTIRRLEQSRPLRTLRKHRRTDGINGVTMTRSIEDLSDIMLSELTLPELMQMQRLMNEGYLSRFRPPKQEQNRDVLLAVLLPGEVRDSLPGTFVKACWFDLCLRLGQRLCQSGLYQSEFRLIEGDRLGMYRTESFPLAALRAPELADGDQPSEFYRHDFLNSMHWLPRFLNEQGIWSDPVPQRGGDGLSTGDNIADWCAAAWKSHVELPSPVTGTPSRNGSTRSGSSRTGSAAQSVAESNRGSASKRRSGSTRLRRNSASLEMADFKFIHVMVVCPNSCRGNPLNVSQKQLKRRLLRGAPPTANLSVTWIPDDLQIDGWKFDTGREPAEEILPASGSGTSGAFVTWNQAHLEADDVSGFAGGLVGSWFRQIQQEIWQG